MDRQSQAKIEKRFINRWSPRAFDNNELISTKDLESIFEAARWTPSSFNSQPWRFVYSTKESKDFDLFIKLLNDFNQEWAKEASALVFIIGKRRNDNGDNNQHFEFDTGASWMALTMQARELGYYTHAMAGVHFEKAYKELSISEEDYKIICACAIGQIGSKEDLSSKLQKNEKPSDRMNLSEIMFKGVKSFKKMKTH